MHIRRISEGSCEDWRNDAENAALLSQELINFKIY